jgi:hypothetical protein
MATVTHCNPDQTLQHLLADFNIPPNKKISRLLGLYGLRFLDMASSLGRHRVHVSGVLNGKRESEVLKRDIAAFFGLEVKDIWCLDQAGSSDRPGEDQGGRGRDQGVGGSSEQLGIR